MFMSVQIINAVVRYAISNITTHMVAISAYLPISYFVFPFLLDIDECRQGGRQVCHQQCHNTHGSYRCSCRPGYELGEDGSTCTGKSTYKGDLNFIPL